MATSGISSGKSKERNTLTYEVFWRDRWRIRHSDFIQANSHKEAKDKIRNRTFCEPYKSVKHGTTAKFKIEFFPDSKSEHSKFVGMKFFREVVPNEELATRLLWKVFRSPDTDPEISIRGIKFKFRAKE